MFDQVQDVCVRASVHGGRMWGGMLERDGCVKRVGRQ